MDKNLRQPLVSVIMSVYNGAEFVAAAIESILDQTFRDFELIIIDDGSTDETPKILKKYKDSRIKIITQENRGLVASLNRGIGLAKGYYIARHDADDISASNRLQIEYDFLVENPEYVIVGSSINVMDEASKVLHQHAVLLEDPELRQELLVRSPFAHGSVMFKKDTAIAAGGYRQEYWPAEDYDLWLRLSRFGKMANLDDFLYTYREFDGGISATNSRKQTERASLIRREAWAARYSLLRGATVDLSKYSPLVMGRMRQERIIDNIVATDLKALRRGDVLVMLLAWSKLILDIATYHLLASRVKSKIRSYI